MIRKIYKLSRNELKNVKKIIGEAFVTNELFHNWGTIEERKEDVMKYMDIYVDYVYKTGGLYSNKDKTGFIGIEDTNKLFIFRRIGMIFKMLIIFKHSKIKKLFSFINQIKESNKEFEKIRHLDVLMVCVEKNHQGKGIAKELVNFAKAKANELSIPLLLDTDMEQYANMYQHLGCQLYNSITADNGVTRYSLCYIPK